MSRAELSGIAFLIANGGHHSEMFLPVMRWLRDRGEPCRAVSLCELRGLPTPVETYRREGFPLHTMLPRSFRSSPELGRQRRSGPPGWPRRLLRRLSWHLLLRPRFGHAFAPRYTRLAVLPNDGAYPYLQICRLLRQRSIPFLIQQEGIRFPQPYDVAQGRGGADAVAVWGQTSADYFRRQGAPPQRLHITGCPRFDDLRREHWTRRGEILGRELGLRRQVLLILTNPIDDLGFCSTEEKMALVGRALEEMAPLFTSDDLQLVLKLHRRESPDAYQRLVDALPYASQVRVERTAPLFPLLALARAAIVIATTAGLEALLYELPLGVLETPGHGFVHDYVARGVALGLAPGPDFLPQVRTLLQGEVSDPQIRRDYLESSLACRGSATAAVGGLIEGLLGTGQAIS